MCDYEEEVKEKLGKEAYEACLDNCDKGKIKLSHICEISRLFDPRIQTALTNQDESIRNSPRKSFQFVMSQWFNTSADPRHKGDKISLPTLINIFETVKLFHCAEELEDISGLNRSDFEDRPQERKLKRFSSLRGSPYPKKYLNTQGGSYDKLPRGGRGEEGGGGGVGEGGGKRGGEREREGGMSQGFLRGARSEASLQTSREEKRFLERMMPSLMGAMRNLLDPAGLGKSRSMGRLEGSLESIYEEDQHVPERARTKAIAYEEGSMSRTPASRRWSETNYTEVFQAESPTRKQGLEDLFVKSVIQSMNTSKDLAILAEVHDAIQHLKEHIKFSRCVWILETAVQKCSLKRTKRVSVLSSEEEPIHDVPEEGSSVESHEGQVLQEGPDKSRTLIIRKDMNFIIDRTLLTDEQKDIFVFNKLAHKLGVGTALSMDIDAKKKPGAIMKIILRAWEQTRGTNTTAEELLVALNYSTEGMKQDIFLTLKPIVKKWIDENKRPRNYSKEHTTGQRNSTGQKIITEPSVRKHMKWRRK